MYKYAKVKGTENEGIVYAEKSGLYCDLCGGLICVDSERNYPRIARRIGDTSDIPINTILPTIRIRSLVADREIDICPECESDILRKISINSGVIMEDLLKTSRHEILDFQENRRRDQEYISNLRKEVEYLQDAISAVSNKYE